MFDSTNVASWALLGIAKKFDPVLVHRAKMEEKDFIDKIGVHDVVSSVSCLVGCQGVPWSLQ